MFATKEELDREVKELIIFAKGADKDLASDINFLDQERQLMLERFQALEKEIYSLSNKIRVLEKYNENNS